LKRTVEITLTVIGLILTIFGTILVGVSISLFNSNTFINEFENMFLQIARDEGITIDSGDIQMIIATFQNAGWIVLALLIVSLILSIISIYFFVGNKKSTTASVLVIVAAIIVAISTFLAGFLPALFYLIAGIIGFVRKTPKTTHTLDERDLTTEQNHPHDLK